MGFKKVLLLTMACPWYSVCLNAMDPITAISAAVEKLTAAETDPAALPKLYEAYVTALDRAGYHFQIVQAVMISAPTVEHTPATCRYYERAAGQLSHAEARMALLALVKKQE